MGNIFVGEFSDEYQEWLGGCDEVEGEAWLDIAIGELGREGVVSAGRHEVVRQAARRMSGMGCGAVVVLEQGKIVGIFTERDLCERVVAEGRDPDHTPIGEVMTPDPATILESDTLGQALRVLVLGAYRHIPVIDTRGQVINVVSVRRIMEHVAERFPNQVFNAPLESQPPPPPVSDGG